ncbi:hypothetical protein OG470_20295 [Micromonospora sp. NBC_00389]|uniref:hypothetical protein n=1 Tax=Micromonospora sp. NBC_00389 TaxID=2903586 RepID=UPI002E1D026C
MTTSTPSAAKTVSKGRMKLRVAVADQEPERRDPFVEVHDQVAGLLGGPGRGRMRGDAEDVHPEGGDLHHEQDVQPPQRHGVHMKEVRCE